ncbi:hypothetical protein HDU78_003594 [Chytriomyces hyalinus]|nr:hypothetical protein HDU78_003594 [Chytriomyces hyalinus]
MSYKTALLADGSKDIETFQLDTALATAAEFSHLRTALLLMEAGADPSEYHENGSWVEQGALINASCSGHVEIVRLLLTDARTHPADNDSKAFLLAMEARHIDVAKLLLGNEAQPQSTTRFAHPSALSNTAMRLAAADPNHDSLRMLLADPRLDFGDIEVGLCTCIENKDSAGVCMIAVDFRLQGLLFGNGSDKTFVRRTTTATVASRLPLVQANFGMNADNGNENMKHMKQSNRARNLDNDKENTNKENCQIVSLVSSDKELDSLCDQSDAELSQHAAVALSRNASLEQLLCANIPTVGAPLDQSSWNMTRVVQLLFTLESTNYVPVKSCSFLSDSVKHTWLLPESCITAARQKLTKGTKKLKIPMSAGALLYPKQRKQDTASKSRKSAHLNKNRMRLQNKGLVAFSASIIENCDALANVKQQLKLVKHGMQVFEDIMSVVGNSWLNNTAISAGFQYLIKSCNLANVAEVKGPDVEAMTCAIQNEVPVDSIPILLTPGKQFNWDEGKLLVPTLINGNHWTAGFVDLKCKRILFGNPMKTSPSVKLPENWIQAVDKIAQQMGCPFSIAAFK